MFKLLLGVFLFSSVILFDKLPNKAEKELVVINTVERGILNS